MKIPNIFGKGNEQSEIDRLIEEGADRDIDAVNDEAVQVNDNREGVIKKLVMDIDKLKAQSEAFTQVRKINDERIQRISENIGELRRAGVEREKDINILKKDTIKAIDLVNAVQPEELMKEVKRLDAKIQKLIAMQETDRKIVKYVAEEMKTTRRDISAFRGTESLIKLNNEVKKELTNIKKVQMLVEKHADKVEGLYMDIQKRYNEFLNLSEKFGELEKSFRDIMKDTTRFKTDFENLANKKDINSLSNEVENRLDYFEKRREEFENLISRAEIVTKDVEILKNGLDDRISEMDGVMSKLTQSDRKNYITEDFFNKEMEDLFNSVLEKVEDNRKEMNEKIKSIGK